MARIEPVPAKRPQSRSAACSRRAWLKSTALAVGSASPFFPRLRGAEAITSPAPPVLELASRRELFVDHFLIERLSNAVLKLHEPQLAAATPDPADPWVYGTVIRDGDRFRAYTRGGRGDYAGPRENDGNPGEVTRYAESREGIHWVKPRLGLHEVEGTRENNIVLTEPPFCHNFSPMLDARPGVPPDERFKALAGLSQPGWDNLRRLLPDDPRFRRTDGPSPAGLWRFVSTDGVRWHKQGDEPVIRLPGRDLGLDSQNVSFWSESEGCYVAYFRTWTREPSPRRSISRSTSPDFVQWTEPTALDPNFPGEHLYTSQTQPYFRTPHIYLATPTRFHPERGESTDILFMTARGNRPFDRTFREAFLRPGLDPARWGNRSNYAALNIVPTGPEELSLYASPFRRFTLRTDGFASVHAGADPAELITRPFRFAGEALWLNYSTSAGGQIRVEVQDLQGRALPGFGLSDGTSLVGDTIEQAVTWKRGLQLATLAQRPVRLRFVLREADLFALRFGIRDRA